MPSTRAAMSSGSVTTSYVEPEHELARVQDERLVALRLDLAGQVGLVRGRVDVRVAVVLEDPEEPVQPDVDATTAASSPGPTGSRRSGPASISARMSRSDSSTRAPYRRPTRAGPAAARRRPQNGAHDASTATSPSATPSPKASATPTPPAPTACAAGPTGWPRCWPTPDRATSATPTSRSAAASCRAILDEQLEPALALQPDLVTIYAGANDILRPRVDIDALVAAYDAALGRLAAHRRAASWCSTAFDPGGSAIYRPLRGRFALYNELVREIADRHGAAVVDFWRLREYRDWRLLGRRPDAHGPGRPPADGDRGARHPRRRRTPSSRCRSDAAPELTGAEQLREDLAWARELAGPWVHRRLTGRSSGDAISPEATRRWPPIVYRPPASRVTADRLVCRPPGSLRM